MRWWWTIGVLIGCANTDPSDAPATPVTQTPTVTATPAETETETPSVQASTTAQPEEQAMSALAQRGLEIANDTHRLLPDNVGANLACTSCHLENATRPKAAPWVGVPDRYPRYRKRSGRVDSLPDRMNGCFARSMNGTPLPVDSEEMAALVAYAEYISVGVDGVDMPGAGMPRIEAPEPPDATRGEAVYQTKCIACHQPNGQGVTGADGETLFPPLWGDESFNIAAGMARLDTAAAFVKWNMPLNQGGTLTDQEAYDVAAWFTVQPRPDLEGKEGDWPNGDKPADARY